MNNYTASYVGDEGKIQTKDYKANSFDEVKKKIAKEKGWKYTLKVVMHPRRRNKVE